MKTWVPILGLVFFGGLALIKFGGSSVQSAALFPYRDTAIVAQGRELYAENCAACHGDRLEGEENWRRAKSDGRMPAPPHDRTGHTWHHPEQQLFFITKYGTAALVGPSYKTDMMGFEDELSDAEIIAILSFIKASWPEKIQQRHDQLSQSDGG